MNNENEAIMYYKYIFIYIYLSTFIYDTNSYTNKKKNQPKNYYYINYSIYFE